MSPRVGRWPPRRLALRRSARLRCAPMNRGCRHTDLCPSKRINMRRCAVGGAVFINYRGTDSGSYGALLFAELSRHFGRELVFLDTESIPAGTDYVQELFARVRQARVVLALIGPRWLQTTDSEGRRIDDPNDWIRRELVEAFAAGVRVIPVLTD